MGSYTTVLDEDIFQKFGTTTIGTTWTPISFKTDGGTGGGYLYAPATGTTLRVKAGGNAADVAAGAGAVAVWLHGIDQTGAAVSERVATAGASASASTEATFLRLNRITLEAGTYATAAATGVNTGLVTIETTAGTAVAEIEALAGQSQIAHYFVPVGKCLHASTMALTVLRTTGSDKQVTARLMYRENALAGGTLTSLLGARNIVPLEFETSVGQVTVSRVGAPAFRIPELAEIWLEAKAASGTVRVTASISGHLVTTGTRTRVFG